jgi:hypothetical protein
MERQPEQQFFDQWKPLPLEKGDDCLSDTTLASLAKGKGEAACLDHLNSCEQCRTIVELLRATVETPGKNLRDFLDMARARAKQLDSERRLKFRWRLASVPRLTQVGVLVGAAAFLLALTWGWLDKLPSFRGNQTVTVSYDGDQFTPTLQLLDETIDVLGTPGLSIEKRQAQILKVKKALDALDSNKFSAQQIDVLNEQSARLQILYDTQLLIELAAQRGGPTPNDSKKVETVLYTTYARHSVVASKSAESSHSVLPLVDLREAAYDASGEIRLAKDESTDEKVVVDSVDHGRSPGNAAWIGAAMQDFSDQTRAKVQFRSGDKSWEFHPRVSTLRYTRPH